MFSAAAVAKEKPRPPGRESAAIGQLKEIQT
jgi:hypothetical protein